MTALDAFPLVAIERHTVRVSPAVLRAALWPALLVVQLVALIPVVFGTSAAAEPAWMLIYRTVGSSFAACGLIAWRRRPDSRVGALMTAAGFGMFVWPVLSQVDSPTVLLAGSLLDDLWSLPLVTLLLGYLTGGRLQTRTDYVLVAAFALEMAMEAMVHRWPEASVLELRHHLLSGACLAVALVVLVRWRAASTPGRRAMLPSLAGIVCLLVFAVLQVYRTELTLWLALCSLFVIPVAFLAGLLRSRLARSGLAELLHDVRSVRGQDLEPALARALGDPSLQIVYSPAIETGPGVLPVEFDGRVLAALIFDPSLDEDPELVRAVGAAAAIALENEARVRELQDSRERIVAAGDAERRRLERNLHDGAQQRLISMSLQLRLLRNRVGEDPGAVALVAALGDELTHSLSELRELARGIHPSVLDHGLEHALESLAVRCPVPTRLDCEPGLALSAPVELAAYFVVSEALANVAKYAEATAVSVTSVRSGGRLVIRVTDDGVGGASADGGSGLRGLADRVGALGGQLRVVSPRGRGTTVTAELAL